ncbi:hypothetical protein Q3G72_000317 [Acer saccharum]|nr:hypothetical protein Q3G72_000317 [Acer saccharum]
MHPITPKIITRFPSFVFQTLHITFTPKIETPAVVQFEMASHPCCCGGSNRDGKETDRFKIATDDETVAPTWKKVDARAGLPISI